MILCNLTDAYYSNMVKELSIEDLEICDGDTHRSLTLDDVENFKTLIN